MKTGTRKPRTSCSRSSSGCSPDASPKRSSSATSPPARRMTSPKRPKSRGAWSRSTVCPTPSDRFSTAAATIRLFLGRDFGEDRNYSEEVAFKIDTEVRKIIDDCYGDARRILEANWDKVERMVASLLEHETVETEEVLAIMNNKAWPPSLRKSFRNCPPRPRRPIPSRPRAKNRSGCLRRFRRSRRNGAHRCRREGRAGRRGPRSFTAGADRIPPRRRSPARWPAAAPI